LGLHHLQDPPCQCRMAGNLSHVPFTISDQVAEGDRVDRFVDGKIAEMWPSYDLLGMLQQLGFVPTRGQ